MRYIIKWETGYAKGVEDIEAESKDEALLVASKRLEEDIKYTSSFDAFEFTEELRHKYNFL